MSRVRVIVYLKGDWWTHSFDESYLGPGVTVECIIYRDWYFGIKVSIARYAALVGCARSVETTAAVTCIMSGSG